MEPVGQLVFEPNYADLHRPHREPGFAMAFPYVFPGAYSAAPGPERLRSIGWIHSPEPEVIDPGATIAVRLRGQQPLAYLQSINHNPLDVGRQPRSPLEPASGYQTWWGFPTWRETLSRWTDPTVQINGCQRAAAWPQSASCRAGAARERRPGRRRQRLGNMRSLLPADDARTWRTYARKPLLRDGFGANNAFFPANTA